MPVLLHNNKAIEKAHSIYKQFTLDSEQMAKLEAQEKWEHDFKTRMDDSWNKGKKDGIDIGKKEGKQEKHLF